MRNQLQNQVLEIQGSIWEGTEEDLNLDNSLRAVHDYYDLSDVDLMLSLPTATKWVILRNIVQAASIDFVGKV